VRAMQALAAPPGAAPLMLGERAFEKLSNRKSKVRRRAAPVSAAGWRAPPREAGCSMQNRVRRSACGARAGSAACCSSQLVIRCDELGSVPCACSRTSQVHPPGRLLHPCPSRAAQGAHERHAASCVDRTALHGASAVTQEPDADQPAVAGTYAEWRCAAQVLSCPNDLTLIFCP
jgi:hypothetical protein